jgi:hypothetical protein
MNRFAWGGGGPGGLAPVRGEILTRFAWGATLVALVFVAAPAWADDAAATEKPYVAPWYKRWFGIGPDAPKPAPGPKRTAAQEAQLQLALAQANHNRRLEVIDQLREIAWQTKNEALMRKADALEKQALDLYMKQTAALPCSNMVPSADERLLDKQLDLGAGTSASAARKLEQPAADTSRTGQASAIREIKP